MIILDSRVNIHTPLANDLSICMQTFSIPTSMAANVYWRSKRSLPVLEWTSKRDIQKF